MYINANTFIPKIFCSKVSIKVTIKLSTVFSKIECKCLDSLDKKLIVGICFYTKQTLLVPVLQYKCISWADLEWDAKQRKVIAKSEVH